MLIETYTGSDTMKKILVIPNRFKDKELKITLKIIGWLMRNDYEVRLPIELKTTQLFRNLDEGNQLLSYCIDDKSELNDIDIGLVLGGDGTIIAASRQYVEYNIALLGINLGNLGFLAEIEVSEWEKTLTTMKSEEFIIDERMMIAARLFNGKELGLALNDIVITRQSISRMISFDVFVNGGYVNSYRADGVILSTPTGSTAYNLSAGGPIISPTNESIIITPICPHSLAARSIVLSGEDEVMITFDSPRNKHVDDLLITIDGQEVSNISKFDQITVNKHHNKVKLIKLTPNSFFDILRKKLN